MFDFFRRRRRARLRAAPFPPAWDAILDENVPAIARLSPADRDELRGHVQIFLAEKRFEGCGGLALTDEIRVTIAAQACLLLLHRETSYYPELGSILVYPSAYVVPGARRGPDGLVVSEDVRLGESWTRGAVVLAWDSVLRGAADVKDGHNVVLHEFAHQLDQEDGEANGTPVLPRSSMYLPWVRVLSREYDALVAKVEAGKKTDLERYGATHPAEFFAVLTEAFFEKPRKLRDKHPALYEQLRAYYQQDPAA